MRYIYIILLCTVASVIYGIIHDQITARICVEYFTIAHPPIFNGTSNPTYLGLGWGVIATWWVGFLLGIPLALAGLAGERPKRSVKSLIRPVAVLLIVMGICATAAGLMGYYTSSNDWLIVPEPFATEIPAEKHVRFMIDVWVHNASYLVGFVGGITLILMIWFSRKKINNN